MANYNEEKFEVLKEAYLECCAVDDDFDQRFFHVMMENPYDSYIFEARREIENINDKEVVLHPDFREKILTFLDALMAVGEEDSWRGERTSAIYDLYREHETFSSLRKAADFQATHDKNGFQLSAAEVSDKAVDVIGDLLNVSSKYPSYFTKMFSKEFVIDVVKAFSKSTFSKKTMNKLIDKADDERLTIGEYNDWFRYANKVYSACYLLENLNKDMVPVVLKKANDRAAELADKEKTAEERKQKLIEERKKVIPEFVGDIIGDKLGWISDGEFNQIRDTLEKYGLKTPEALLEFYSDFNFLNWRIERGEVVAHVEKMKEAASLEEQMASAEAQRSEGENKVCKEEHCL